jgi:hypothetical protein
MHEKWLTTAAGLSDAELLRRLALLAGSERAATVELIGHLAELDARRLHLAQGFGSLFAYCTEELRLSEHAAYNRIEAARLVRAFPAVLDRLAEGSLNLSTARLLAPHLRPDNFDALVAAARGRSKREVEALVARLSPRPDVASSVRKLPSRRQAAPESAAMVPTPAQGALPPVPCVPLAAPSLGAPASRGHAATPLLLTEPTPHRAVVTPLAPERYRVQFTVGTATHDKLRRVQELLRREIPDGDPAAIFDRALTLLLDDVARRKLATTAKPRPTERARPAPSGSRHIPAHVKRAVWARDGGRCAFVGANGRRCSERVFLEFHHCEPYALGGETTVGNLSLRCRGHNGHEAELIFGAAGPRLAPGRVAPREARTLGGRESAQPREKQATGTGALG